MRWGLRSGLKRVTMIVIAVAILGIVLWQAEVLPHPWPAALAFSLVIALAVLTAGRTVLDLLDTVPPAYWFGAEAREQSRMFAGTDHRVIRLRQLLSDA